MFLSISAHTYISLPAQNEDQLRSQAQDDGVDTEGDKDDIISRLAAKRKQEDNDDEDNGGMGGKKMKILGNGKNPGSSSSSSSSSALTNHKSNDSNNSIVIRSKQRIVVDNLPANMHSMSEAQLRSVCAANGILHLISKTDTKSDILNILENDIYDRNDPITRKDQEKADRLNSKNDKKENSGRAKGKNRRKKNDDDSENDGDSDYEEIEIEDE